VGALKEVCRELRVREATVASVDRSASRLSGEEPKRFTLKLLVSLKVVSDYLFIGSGRVARRGLEEALGRVRGIESISSVDNALRVAGQAVSRVMPVKDFYRVFNPYSGRVQPAIPGSSLKGAVRARIELASRGKVVVAGFLYPGPDTGALQQLPPIGVHGWRHARIWCESVAEIRRVEKLPSIADDLFGMAEHGYSLGSRVFFGTFYPLDPKLECQELLLDHNERVCAVPKGAIFRGEIVAVNVDVKELGLLFYGLGLDKLLCGKRPWILLGASKYRCRTVGSSRKTFGIVEVSVENIVPAPWSHMEWSKWATGKSVEEIVRGAVERALEAFPGLPKCFDEVERRLALEPCR